MTNESDNYCYYCGMPASAVDHVIPQSLLRMYDRIADPEIYDALVRRRRLTVPCCHECNCLLGATIQKTIQKRKQYLKERLRRRYKKLLSMPDWTDSEIEEMGEKMQTYIWDGVNKKNDIRQRLAW